MIGYDEATAELTRRFGRDSLIGLATVDAGRPWVRTVSGYYEDGAFYVVTYALSNKMKQIAVDPHVAVCGEWFTAHGIGQNLGHVLDESNAEMMAKVREAFSEWYTDGDVDESDPHTCLLRVQLTDGVLSWNHQRHQIDFVAKTV